MWCFQNLPSRSYTAVCSRCHLPAPGYDQLAERRFEFIPLGGSRLPSVHHAAGRLSPLRSCGCRRSSLGRRQTHTDQSLDALLSPLGAATIAPHGNRGPRAGAEEVALAAAQTRGESEDGTALPVARSASLQLKTVRAYLLKEAFQQIWDYNSPESTHEFF